MEDGTNASSGGLTLGGILSIKQTPPYHHRIQDRTLLDLIRDDQACGSESSKNTWKMLREKLRLRLLRSACSTAVPTIASHVHITTDGTETTRLISPHTSSVPDTQTENVETELPETSTEEGNGDGGEPTAVRMSLMSLLEVEGAAAYVVDDEEEKEEEEEEETAAAMEESGGGGGGGGGGYRYNYCCVCMVRHKGAAFIPCGHTFCRLCSRELFVKRASCPLCNNFILEILDIF